MNCLMSTLFKLAGIPQRRNNAVTRTETNLLPGENIPGSLSDRLSEVTFPLAGKLAQALCVPASSSLEVLPWGGRMAEGAGRSGRGGGQSALVERLRDS